MCELLRKTSLAVLKICSSRSRLRDGAPVSCGSGLFVLVSDEALGVVLYSRLKSAPAGENN